MSLTGRIRRFFYGDDRATQDRLSSILRSRSRFGAFGPGIRTGFEHPPSERVILDHDLPWELRDDPPLPLEIQDSGSETASNQDSRQ